MNRLTERRNALIASAISGGGSRLPSEYQEVEWIRSYNPSGSVYTQAYINTGFKVTSNNHNNVRFVVDIAFINNSRWALYGYGNESASSEGMGSFYVGTHVSTIYYGLGRNSSTGVQATVGNRYTYDLDTKRDTYKVLDYANNEYIVDISNLNHTGYFYDTGFTLWLFGYGGEAQKRDSKCFGAKIYENDILQRDFVPCYRKADGEIGMYDLVNDVFYTNAGSSTFTKGADV